MGQFSVKTYNPPGSVLGATQQALAIYDRNNEGATIAACHLQAAIDAATGAKPLKPGDEIDPELLAAFDARIGRRGKRPR